MRLSEIKNKVPIKIIRDGIFRSVGKMSQNKPSQLVFLSDESYISNLSERKNISCIITSKKFASMFSTKIGLVIADNPRKTFYLIHDYLAHHTDFYGQSFKTFIHQNSIIHPTAFVAEKNVKIGRGSIIGPGVSILENSIIGSNVIIGAGTRIGIDGFEYQIIDKQIVPAIHTGGVYINNQVEIKSNCCIVKGLFGDKTEIGHSTKIGSMTFIAHNSLIGKRCLITPNVMIGGSVVIGNDVWIGPSSSISNQVKIGNEAYITIGSVVVNDVKPGEKVTGNFAVEHNKFMSSYYKLNRKL